MDIIKCPVCNRCLHKENRIYKCESNHTFDIAKQGHVNLLLNRDKSSKEPGDSKFMLESRRNFLNKNYYQNISNSINSIIKNMIEKSEEMKIDILDSGCGEGYYLAELKKEINTLNKNINFYGIDISKSGVKLSTGRDKDINWIVANSLNMPFFNDSFDYILSMFTSIDIQDAIRVLKPNGKIVLVTTNHDHLKELKEIIYPVLTEKKGVSDIEIPGMKCIQEEVCKYEVNVESGESLKDLLTMTPHFWKTTKENKELLNNYMKLKITVDITIRVLKKFSVVEN